MDIRAACEARFSRAVQNGLKDAKFLVEEGRTHSVNEFLGFLEQMDTAIEDGKAKQFDSWDRDEQTTFIPELSR